MEEAFCESQELVLLQTMPGVGFILAVVILLEIGSVTRFGSPSQLASYSGATPRAHASGGKVQIGQVRSDVNRYLKWAFAEAANVICLNHRRCPALHASQLYQRIRQRRGHQAAVGAVARHMAESAYWILKKGEPYREPRQRAVSSKEG